MSIIEVMNGLVSCPNVNICLSSRPWNQFEAAFGADIHRKLHVQELNKADIWLYTTRELEQNTYLTQLKATDSLYDELVSEVVSKSSGVFLWVSLVVRSLLAGFNNEDRVFDLQRRLHQMPDDLEDFYGFILASIEQTYKAQAARAFDIALFAPSSVFAIDYWHLDFEEEDPDFVMTLSVQSYDASIIKARNEMIRKGSMDAVKECWSWFARTKLPGIPMEARLIFFTAP